MPTSGCRLALQPPEGHRQEGEAHSGLGCDKGWSATSAEVHCTMSGLCNCTDVQSVQAQLATVQPVSTGIVWLTR